MAVMSDVFLSGSPIKGHLHCHAKGCLFNMHQHFQAELGFFGFTEVDGGNIQHNLLCRTVISSHKITKITITPYSLLITGDYGVMLMAEIDNLLSPSRIHLFTAHA